MQVNVAGLRRNIKNLAHNYSDAQVKVREATSNDPWGPSATIMAEIANMTYNVVAFSEIMQMIWKRLNDHGKNWRHVYKALILLEYLIKTGNEKVAQQCKENIFAIQTLREFVYFEEGKDQGTHVRDKAKQLVILLKDDERLKNERQKAMTAKERFAQHPSGFGSDGYIDGPSHRDMPPGWQEEPPKPLSDLEMVRPQTAGEEELQLQLAMAMSREEAEQEEAKRRSDDVRLQLALSQSEQDFKTGPVVGKKEEPAQPQSHLMDLLDISLGATSISSPPPLGAMGGAMGGGGPSASDPWGTPARAASQLSDPWSGNASPQIHDPWQPTAGQRSHAASVPLGASGLASNGDIWSGHLGSGRTQSPSVVSAGGSSSEGGAGWLHSNGASGGGAAAVGGGLLNGNGASGGVDAAEFDQWLAKSSLTGAAAAAPPAAPPSAADPWMADAGKAALEDPWAPKSAAAAAALSAANDDPWKALENAGAKKPSPDLDEFDIISNRNKNGDLMTTTNNNNNNATLLDDMDPLGGLGAPLGNGLSGGNMAASTGATAKKPLKTPQAFLGENSALVNLDNLIKPIAPQQTQAVGSSAAYNPFSDTVTQSQPKTNLFQQQQPAVPSINQLKQQQPFAMTLGQDPWAPISSANTMAAQAHPHKATATMQYVKADVHMEATNSPPPHAAPLASGDSPPLHPTEVDAPVAAAIIKPLSYASGRDAVATNTATTTTTATNANVPQHKHASQISYSRSDYEIFKAKQRRHDAIAQASAYTFAQYHCEGAAGDNGNNNTTTTTANYMTTANNTAAAATVMMKHTSNNNNNNNYTTTLNYSQSVDNIRNMQIAHVPQQRQQQQMDEEDPYEMLAAESFYFTPPLMHGSSYGSFVSAGSLTATNAYAVNNNNNNNNNNNYNSLSNALQASLAATPGITLLPLPLGGNDAAAVIAPVTHSRRLPPGGTLFDYGFYDPAMGGGGGGSTVAATSVLSGNCKFENNNNMMWLQTDGGATAAAAPPPQLSNTSNPFLS